MLKSTRSRIALGALTASLLVGCGSDGPSTESGSADPNHSTIELLRERMSGSGSMALAESWKTISDVLPVTGKPTVAGASMMAIGTVADVRLGASYSWDDPFTMHQLKPGSADAHIDTVYVDLAVSKGSAPDGIVPSKLTFGLSFLPPVDVDAIKRDLLTHDEIAVLLVREGNFSADPEVWDVMFGGSFFGFVDANVVSFPLLADYPFPAGFAPPAIPVDDLSAMSKAVIP